MIKEDAIKKITYIKGRLIEKTPTKIIVEANGIGYDIKTPPAFVLRAKLPILTPIARPAVLFLTNGTPPIGATFSGLTLPP